MTPSTGWFCSTPPGKKSPIWHPMLPKPIGVCEVPTGRFHATYSVHLPWRQHRVRLHLGWTLSWDGESSVWTDASVQSEGGAGSTWTQCLSLSSGKGESRMSSSAQAQGRSGHCPLCTGQARLARAEGNSQHRRNVLLHGREEITAKECAVPRPGLGGAREKAAGRKNKLHLSQGYSPLVTNFSLLPLK